MWTETPEDSLHSDEALFTARLLQAIECEQVQALPSILNLLARILGCRTVAIFYTDGREVVCGNGAALAEKASLTGLIDPVIANCAKTLSPQRNECQAPSPIFTQEVERWAYPLAHKAVLYLGEPQRWSELKAQRLSRHLLGYLNILERHQDNAHREQEQSALLLRLELNAGLIRRCLKALHEQELELDLRSLLKQAFLGLRDELPFSNWLVLWQGELFGGELTQDALTALTGLSESSSSVRAVETLSSTPYRDLSSLGESLLVAPLRSGLLLLFAAQPFEPQHRDTLDVIATYLGIALEQAFRHKTVVATQSQLASANKLAAVGQLAAGLAHELNNPLGSITLALDSCHRFVEKNPKIALSVLAEAHKAAARAHDIVTKLLHFSRDSRQGQRNCTLREILEELQAVVGPLLRRDGVVLEVTNPDNRSFFLNPGEIGQALSNLVLNARDAVLEGQYEKRVKIDFTSRPEAVAIRVIDQGPGIPEQLRSRIYEPFFTTKPVGKGTGLGLSLARQMVEDQGGTLRLEEFPRGCCFVLELPTQSATTNLA